MIRYYDDDDHEPRRISNAEKARLHRKRCAEVERRERERQQREAAGLPVRTVAPTEYRDRRQALQNEDGYFEPTWKKPIKKAVNGNSYEDEDFDDDDRDSIEIAEVIRLLKSNAWYHAGLMANAATLRKWLNDSEEFAEAWREFTNSGGIDADDFKNFMDGTFRCRRIRRKKHLRLVANNKPQRLRLRR